MGKCLVTKLNGTVDNDNLLRIGEIRLINTKLSNPTANSQYMSLTFSKDANLEIVGDAYDEPEYDEPSLSDHAEYASKLSTGMSRLNESLPGINNFAGDTQAPFAASLRTHYARESAIEDIDDADYVYQDALDAIESAIDDVDPEDAYQDAVDAIESALSPTDESDSDSDVEDDFDADDIDQGLENCKNALESMIADLDALELENN